MKGSTNIEKSVFAIETKNLGKCYTSSSVALDSLNIQVKQGEIFGFLGSNGSGKTTTIRILLDIIRPTTGTAKILGIDCQQKSAKVRDKIGYLPGELNLYGNYCGNDILNLFNNIRIRKASEEYVQYLCSQLDADMRTRTKKLSFGNRQKVGLILALAFQSELIILDEPTKGLDPFIQRKALELLSEVRAAGKTVFFSSHDLKEVGNICDRVAIIRKGVLVAIETMTILQKQKLHRIRISFNEPVRTNLFSNIPGVRVLEHTKSDVYLEVVLGLDKVIKIASGYNIVDLVSERPSLEDYLMSYYKSDEPVGTDVELNTI